MLTIPALPTRGTSVRSAEFRSNLQSERFHSSHLRLFIGTEESIPEEMDYAEIAVRMSVMNEVQFLFASKPCKPLKA